MTSRIPHDEATPIEALCLEYRVRVRGKDYHDTPCVCEILKMGYQLGYEDTVRQIKLATHALRNTR